MNLRKGKRRLISDGSTKLHPKEIVVNEMTSIENEPRITFGETKNKVLTYLWNLRICGEDRRSMSMDFLPPPASVCISGLCIEAKQEVLYFVLTVLPKAA
jgi:hypothetical protein